MQGLAHDVRFAFRQLQKNLGFSFTAVCVLALGVCACVAIFAFVDAALIKPLPYRDPNRLVGVTESAGKIPRANLSYLDYLDWKKANTVFSSFDALTGAGYMLTTPTGTDLVRGVRVTDGFFRTLGVSPILGRDFYAGESQPAAANTVILSYATWKKRFAGGSDAIGKTVVLSGVPYTIIGVLPREFRVRSAQWRGVLGDAARSQLLRAAAKLPQPDRHRALERGRIGCGRLREHGVGGGAVGEAISGFEPRARGGGRSVL